LEPFVLDRCVAWVTRSVVALDVYEVIEGCQCTVLNIDGRVPDEGTLVETTLAWSTGHPVIPYKTTTISELGGNNNPMIGVISGWAPVSRDPAGLVTAVKAAVKAMGAAPPAPTLPPDVQYLVGLGGVIAGIRGKSQLTKKGLAAAAKTLSAIPAAQLAILEPISSLQPMSLQLLLAIIEFSKLRPNQKAKQRTLFQNQIAALQAWAATTGVRDAILQNPLSA
jgi:hypothetical protein